MLGWHDQGTAALVDPYDRLADHVAANLDSRYLEDLLVIG
jgi:hypothetical protein